MNVAVFCSANDLADIYNRPAVELVHLLAKRGYSVVWGGSDRGLMKLVADAVQESGGKLIGVSVELLKHVARKNVDEMIISKNMGERKAIMFQRSDAFVILVGGLGTLAEAFEIIDLKKLAVHNKPIVILNTNNFYDDLIAQLKKMKKEGFIAPELNTLLCFAKTPQEVISFIAK